MGNSFSSNKITIRNDRGAALRYIFIMSTLKKPEHAFLIDYRAFPQQNMKNPKEK
jgi:hypothetical protein